MAETTSSTDYEPNVIDIFDYSETYTAIFQNESVDIDTEPSNSFDAELDDELIRKALSSPVFTQEREEPANLRQTYHSHEESLLPAQSFTRTSTGKLVYEPSSNLSQKRKSSRDLENKQITLANIFGCDSGIGGASQGTNRTQNLDVIFCHCDTG